MKKLAIVTTHPIQYYAPMFKLLHESGKIAIRVFYTRDALAGARPDPGFGRVIEWDLPLLEGYPYEWIKNTPGQLIKAIESWQPGSVLVFGWAFPGHLKALRHFKKKLPVFFRGDSTLLDRHSLLKYCFKLHFLQWVYRQVDYALYVGSNNRLYFKRYGLKEQQLIFMPHAVDNARFGISREQEAARLRAGLNIGEQELLLLFAGKLEAKKDPLLLLQAFLQLKKQGLHLLFTGNGVLEQRLKEQANLHPCIHFMDFSNQQYMPVVYQAADLFCLPSAGPAETWGLAVNEAMACAKPVLVSDKTGCAADLVKPGFNGAIFKSGSLSSLSEQLEQLLGSGKKELGRMGIHSKKMIGKWSFQQQLKAIEKAVITYGLP